MNAIETGTRVRIFPDVYGVVTGHTPEGKLLIQDYQSATHEVSPKAAQVIGRAL